MKILKFECSTCGQPFIPDADAFVSVTMIRDEHGDEFPKLGEIGKAETVCLCLSCREVVLKGAGP